jgi:hypothetical protein
VERLSPAGGPGLEPAVREDLLDLAIVWADLQVRLAPTDGKEEARRRALTALAEAEALCGPSLVLDEERRLHAAPGRPAGRGARAPGREGAPDTAWDHYALGRALIRSGDLDRAAEEVERAIRLQPQGL